MNDDLNNTIQSGTLISGRYKIISALGAGAMGDVYLCAHKDLQDKLFVLKVLKSEIANDKNIMKRFQNEVIAALNVSHENVVRAYEFIKEGDLVGYTMEYVRGGDLADRMEISAQLPIDLTINYLYQMCTGTAALHKHGIIHRDLKPENILITDDDIVKISDFGISMMDQNSRLTETGTLLGSTNYIAPEYIQFQKVDERTDVYALGIIAYEMVTGTDPFPGENMFIKMQQRTQLNPYDPRMYRNDCPENLALWINKCITISPKDRFQNCQEMLEALAEVDPKQVGTFSKPRASLLNSQNRTAYELKDSVSEALGGTRQKVFAENYKSEVIDLTKARPLNSPYITQSITAKSKRKPVVHYLVLGILLAVSLFLLLNQPADVGNVNIATGDPYTPQIKKKLPDIVNLETKVDQLQIEGRLVFEQGNIENVNFSVLPPAIENATSVINKLSLTNIISAKDNGLDFTVLANARFEITKDNQKRNVDSTIRINGWRSSDYTNLKLHFVAPDKFDTKSVSQKFGFREVEGAEQPFLFGTFIISAADLDTQ